MKGLELAKRFNFECVQPIITENLSQLNDRYAAGLIGYGSDVLGNDDDLSRDHEWGLRLILFLNEADHSHSSDRLDKILNQALPQTFLGFPTRFKREGTYGNSSVMTMSAEGRHHIVITTPDRFLFRTLGWTTVPQHEMAWLCIPEQKLLEFTSGAIFTDPVGDITLYRKQLAYFPKVVWQYKLAYLFESLGWELGLIALCGRRGDTLSMHINTAVTIERIMKLAFLLLRRYCPGYKKWLQREFAKLPDTATKIEPLLHQAFETSSYQEITRCVNEALEILYQKLLSLDEIEVDLPAQLPRIDDRGTIIIDTQHVSSCLLDALPSPLRALRIHNAPFGAIDQWVTNEDILLSAEHVHSLQSVYSVTCQR
ncbi:DUF4037 domain-containing protein [Chloroflexi bacterium TSY]|nr:DUF4037 domain-containing protein [Chloroflexi bacterium TSY]